MKPKIVRFTPTFFKDLKKFPKSQLRFLDKQQEIFNKNIFDPRLKTHKLRGQMKDFYSFSISFHWRIVFHIEKGNTIVFNKIGTHSVYK